MADGGWVGIAIPEAYGGGGRGINEASLVLEEVAASGAAMNGCSAVHLSIFGMHPVVLHGSEEMRRRYLPRVAKGDLHIAFGVTEPDAGTDTPSIKTRALPGARRQLPDPGPQGVDVEGAGSGAGAAAVPHDAARGVRQADRRHDPVPGRSQGPGGDDHADPEGRSERRGFLRSRLRRPPGGGGRPGRRGGARLPVPRRRAQRRADPHRLRGARASGGWRCGGRWPTPRSGSCSAGPSARTRRWPSRWPRSTPGCGRRR